MSDHHDSLLVIGPQWHVTSVTAIRKVYSFWRSVASEKEEVKWRSVVSSGVSEHKQACKMHADRSANVGYISYFAYYFTVRLSYVVLRFASSVCTGKLCISVSSCKSKYTVWCRYKVETPVYVFQLSRAQLICCVPEWPALYPVRCGADTIRASSLFFNVG
jgi:hypothetical protein